MDAHHANAKSFILGGGKKFDDGIFKYKKGFSPDGVVDFSVQCLIFNKNIYDGLISEWEKKKFKQILGKGYFQKYLLN